MDILSRRSSSKKKEKAEGSFAFEQALMLYNDALDSLSKIGDSSLDDKRSKIMERIGDITVSMGEYNQTIDKYMGIEEIVEDDETKARMLRKVGEIHASKGEYEDSLDFLDKAKGLAGEGTAEYGRILYAQGPPHMRKGDMTAALNLFEQAVCIAEKVGDSKKDLGNAFRSIGSIEYTRGDHEKAMQFFEKSLAMMEESDEPYGIAAALNNIGLVHRNRSEIELALEYYDRNLDILKRIGNILAIANLLNNIGNVYWNLGELDRTLEY